MTRSLLARVTLLQQVTAVVAIAAFALLALWITQRTVSTERRAFVASTATRLAGSFGKELEDDPDTLAAARSLVDDGLDVGLRVEVRDAEGNVLASSLARPAAAAAGPPPSAGQLVSQATGPLGVAVTVVGSDAASRAGLSALARSLVLAALPILLLSLLVGRLIVARALRPLSTMAERAAGLSAERNPRSLGAHFGLAEVDHLASSFDRLLERLDDALRTERRLTADVSHELRTPLTVLGGELELLRERTPPESSAGATLARVAEQVAAMRELVDAVLVLHRSREIGPSGAVGFEVLNLSDLAREALAETRPRYPGRELDVALDAPDELLVDGNTALLASAARNLFDNALKFTRAGDRIVILVGGDGGRATLAVDDSGSGVREDERERIFDPFFRGAQARAGSSGFGLGLPILRRVARAHGGDVEVSTSPLGGARFVMWLPLRAMSPGTG